METDHLQMVQYITNNFRLLNPQSTTVNWLQAAVKYLLRRPSLQYLWDTSERVRDMSVNFLVIFSNIARCIMDISWHLLLSQISQTIQGSSDHSIWPRRHTEIFTAFSTYYIFLLLIDLFSLLLLIFTAFSFYSSQVKQI